MSLLTHWNKNRVRTLLVIFYLALAIGECRYWVHERPIYPTQAMLAEKWPPAGYLVDAYLNDGRGVDIFAPGTTVSGVVRSYGLPLLVYGSMHAIPPFGVLEKQPGGWTVRSMTQEERFIWQLPMDANSCTPEELQLIPSIGPSLAGRIHKFIKQRCGIRSVNELDDVKGVGSSRMSVLIEYLSVRY
jgi:hypothetical protein